MDIKLLTCEENYQKLLCHRQSVYEHAQLDYLLEKSPNFKFDLAQDKVSMLFFGMLDSEIIASCRLTEFASLELGFQHELMKLCPDLAFDKVFFISRVCVSLPHQGKQRYKQLLAYVCEWASMHHRNQYYIAKCRVELTSLYLRLGCVVIEGSRCHDELNDVEYIYLLGNIQETNKYLTKGNLNEKR